MAYLVHLGVIVCCNIEFQGMVKSFHILKATRYVQFIFLKHRNYLSLILNLSCETNGNDIFVNSVFWKAI